jgi:hypothetical protein
VKVSTPWLRSPLFDSLLILAPSFVAVALVFFFRASFEAMSTVPIWAWVILVLGIDVAHVYGTLFRTYFNRIDRKKNATLFTLVPVFTLIAGILLYSIGATLFWSALAYLAVFHFIRQQYGFMRLYSRGDRPDRITRRLSEGLIYAATLYPIIYWHSHLPRNFTWFVEGDFVGGVPKSVERIALLLYLILMLAYGLNELRGLISGRAFNLPKNLLIGGTALSWFVGIVLFDGDMIFTITNVVSHGIPYMALVWTYQRKSETPHSSKNLAARFGVFLFVGALLLFAFLEEGLWAGLVWREHFEFFGFFSKLPEVRETATLTWLIPLLSLPQATHYVLDGFIWKIQKAETL